jgi:hypothetical protein
MAKGSCQHSYAGFSYEVTTVNGQKVLHDASLGTGVAPYPVALAPLRARQGKMLRQLFRRR